MKALILLLLLSGCAAAQRVNPWASIPLAVTTPAAVPLPLGPWPRATPITANGQQWFAFDLDGANQLTAIREKAEANTKIAAEHAQAVDDYRKSHDELVRAGEAEFELGETRRAMLDDERRERLFEKLGTWALLGLLGIVEIKK